MTDVETIAGLQAEISRLTRELDAVKGRSWGDNLASVVDYVATNKVKLTSLAFGIMAFVGMVWNRVAPATDHEAVQQVASEEVKAKVPAAVEKAVDARPVPERVIETVREVPFTPGAVKTNEEKK